MTIVNDASQPSDTTALGGAPLKKDVGSSVAADVEEQKIAKGKGKGQESLDPRERKLRHWKNSIYAVGCVNVDWRDDNPCCSHPPGHKMNAQMAWSGVVFGACSSRVKRIGNMAVFWTKTEAYEEVQTNEAGERSVVKRKRSRPICMVGPYWPVNFCLTWPLILGISGWTTYTKVIHQDLGVIISWSICIFVLCASLLLVSCSNPGILYRHAQAPSTEESADWRWNDQARTFRPSHARFDNECQVVIEAFDHTCPWTGTGIGGGNMQYFRVFVCMVPVCIIYTVVLHVIL